MAATFRSALEHFQFETLRVSNHTACRFAEKTRFFRSLWAGRRVAASRFAFFKGSALHYLPISRALVYMALMDSIVVTFAS